MGHSKEQVQVQTLQDVVSLLQAGDRCVICVPAGENPFHFSINSGTPGLESSLLVLPFEPPVEKTSKSIAKTLSLEQTLSANSAIRLLKAKLGRVPKRTVIILDITHHDRSWWKSEKERIKFFEESTRMVTKARLRSLWLISRQAFPSSRIAGVKDNAQFFIDISRIGTTYVGQFLTAKSIYDPEFFLPRIVSWTKGGFVMKNPVLPFIETERTSSAGSPSPVVQDLFEQQYREIVEAARDGIVLFDVKGGHHELNKRGCEILGYTEEELRTLRLSDLVPADRYRTTLRSLAILIAKGSLSVDVVIARKTKRRVIINVNLSRLKQDLFVAVFRDVTDSARDVERLVESREDYARLLESSPFPTAIFANRKLLLGNHAFRRLFSWIDTDENSPVSISDVFGKQNNAFIRDLNAGRMPTGTIDGGTTPALTVSGPSGEQMVLEVSASPVTYKGKQGIQCAFINITQRNSIARELEASRQKFEHLLHKSPNPVAVIRESKFEFVNQTFLSTFEYATASELVDKQVGAVLGKRFEKQMMEGGGPKRRLDDVRVIEFDFDGKNDRSLSFEAQIVNTTFGNAAAFLIYFHDITQRKQDGAELEAKAKSLELLRHVSKAINGSALLSEQSGIALHSTMKGLGFEAGVVYAMENESSLVATSHQGFSEKALDILGRQSLQEGFMGYVNKTQEPLLVSIADYPPYLPYRALFESEKLQLVAVAPLISKGALLGMMMLGTGRRKAFEPFQRAVLMSVGETIGEGMERAVEYSRVVDSESKYRSAVENISDVIYHANPDGGLTYLNPNVERLLGYPRDAFFETADLWRTILHPDDRPKYSQRISNQAQANNDFHIEYRMLPKGKASYRWVRDSIRYMRDAEGKVMSITGILSDITDRFQLEEALRRSEERKASLIEGIQDGVAIYDTELRYIECNHAMEAIAGVPRDQMLGQLPFEGTRDLVGANTRALLERALAGESVSSEDLPYRVGGSREEGYVWARYTPLRNEDGIITGVVGIFSDVTTRKALEREVRESEETLRNVIDAMGDALMISDLQGRVWEVNREFSRLTELPRSEALGVQFPYPWVIDEETAKYVKWIAALREENDLRDFDMTWQTKLGRQIPVSLNTTLLRNALGEPVAMLNIARDISDRMRLAEELERKNLQIELVNRIISKANTTIEFSEIFETIASEVLQLVPYDQINVGILTESGESIILFAWSSPTGKVLTIGNETPLERTVSQISIEQGKAVVINDLLHHQGLSKHVGSIKEGLRSQISIPIYLNEKLLGTFNVASVRENAFTGEELSFLQPIADQIGAMIDRVRLFQKVSDDSKYIHNLLNSIDSVVFTVDKQYRITAVNKAWREFAVRQGLQPHLVEGSIVGRHLEEIVQSQSLWEAYTKVIPRLFERNLEYYSREFNLDRDGDSRTYHLVINPMLVDNVVSGLVFTHTDVTSVKRTEEEIKRRNKELVAVNAMFTAIGESLNLDEVLAVASRSVREILGADMVLVFLQDSQKDQISLAHSLGLTEDQARTLRTLKTPFSAINAVLLHGKPLLIDRGAHSDERIMPERRRVFGAIGIEGLGVVPLRSKNTVVGALDIAFKTEHEFSSQQQQLLLLIGNQLGSAIENALLYSELRAQVQRITSLYELGKSLTGALDTQSLLEIVHAEAAKSIPIDGFFYHSVSEKTSALIPVFQIQSSARPIPGSESYSLAPILESVGEKGESIIVGAGAEGSNQPSVLAVPMKSKSKSVGVISIVRDEPDAFTETHLRILESIANLTEIAIDRARLYEDTVNKSVEIESRNKELDDFTYVVSHDLKEPLISIEGYSKIMLQDYKDKVDAEGREYLSTTVQSANRMKHLIDDLLTLSRVGRVMEQVDTISVGDVVREVLAELQFTLREKQCEVEVTPDLPSVPFNWTQLSMVFRNLISNAIKFNDKPVPRIEIKATDENAHHLFSVSDNGIGIDKQYFDKVFVIFQRLQRSEDYRGTGAGLTIVKKIVENHRGRIWIESEPGKGTTFFFTVPKS